jgi:hypothetical protein
MELNYFKTGEIGKGLLPEKKNRKKAVSPFSKYDYFSFRSKNQMAKISELNYQDVRYYYMRDHLISSPF